MYISAVYPLDNVHFQSNIGTMEEGLAYFPPPIGGLGAYAPASSICAVSAPQSGCVGWVVSGATVSPSGRIAVLCRQFRGFQGIRFAFSLARNFCASSSVRKAA